MISNSLERVVEDVLGWLLVDSRGGSSAPYRSTTRDCPRTALSTRRPSGAFALQLQSYIKRSRADTLIVL
jgi:hypothetical protein